ncbi:MAG TPA: VanZ family protein [Rubrivivax sp.]|nr:VanZ family protein [Rubrivivax sp.]
MSPLAAVRSANDALTPRQKRHLGWLLLAWAIFIAYGSWVPLDFHAADPVEVWRRLWQWSGADALRAQRLDTAVNVLLTVPLGLGLALLWSGPGGRLGLFRQAAIVGLVLPLSLLVEWGQGLLPGRSESLGDVLAQTAGTVIGLLLHALAGSPIRRRLAAIDAAMDLRSRAAQVLHLYLLGLLLFAVMPLDLTLDLGELYRKWRSGRVVLVPFAGLRGTPADIVYELVTDALLWVPVGLLWRLDRARRTLGGIVVRATLLAAGIELAQLLVLSRVSDVTDILLSALGAWLGAKALSPLRALLDGKRARVRSACRIGLAIWLLAVLWIYAWPFAWAWPARGWSAFVDAFARVPFLTYFQRNEFGALNEILRKLLVFLPGGLLLRLVVARPGAKASRAWLLALAVLAFLLEAVQVVLADRVADLTDALLATLGAVLGWRLTGWLQADPGKLGVHAAAADAPDAAGTQGRIAPAGIDGASRDVAGAVDRRATQAGPAAWPAQALTVVVLALLLWLLARLPGVPYNVAKLMPTGATGMLAAAGVAAVAWWIGALPLFYVRASRRVAGALPLLLQAHGLVAFAVLRAAVPLPMLHKVIGAPILGWPGVLEDLLRYLALHAALMLPLCGAAAVVAVARDPQRLNRLIYWALLAVALAWPLHWVVVDLAATDNLVELMRGGGSFIASTCLALAVTGIGIGAAALASLGCGSRRVAVVLLVVAALGTPAALWAGLEPAVFKYGRVFSALQFILSAGRDAYASGPALIARYLAAYVGITLALAWLQRPGWRIECDREGRPGR